MGISNFVNVNNIGITSVRSKKQGELADLIVEQVRIQSDISKLQKIQKELTNLYMDVKPIKLILINLQVNKELKDIITRLK